MTLIRLTREAMQATVQLTFIAFMLHTGESMKEKTYTVTFHIILILTTSSHAREGEGLDWCIIHAILLLIPSLPICLDARGSSLSA